MITIFMKSSHEIIAINIKRLMTHYKLTQVELSKKTGVSQKTISNMINPGSVGGITTQSLEKVSEYFKIEPYHLMISDFPIEELTSTRIDRIIEFYVKASAAGRENINRIAETEAHYSLIPH